MNVVYLANDRPSPKMLLPTFHAALGTFCDFHVHAGGKDMDLPTVLHLLRGADVVLTDYTSRPLPPELAGDPGNIRYVCNLTGSIQGIIPGEILQAGIPVSNWGDATAVELAESALTLLLTLLKEIPARIDRVRAGLWRGFEGLRPGLVHGRHVGLYGYGFSGRKFHDLLRPFQAHVRVYDPFVADLPADAERVDSLEALFGDSEIVSIHAGLNPETRGSVRADLLARLPDGGILINTARGDIVDQDALFAEVERGRLRAGLDVLANGDWLPPEHPARGWNNLMLTCHQLNCTNWPDPGALHFMHHVCLDNLKRFQAGEPLRFLFDQRRLALST